jgi:hypothetical protein
MAIWCISASPLIMGNDMRNISAESKAILMNRHAIAVSQDPLGQMGIRLSPNASATQVNTTSTRVVDKPPSACTRRQPLSCIGAWCSCIGCHRSGREFWRTATSRSRYTTGPRAERGGVRSPASHRYQAPRARTGLAQQTAIGRRRVGRRETSVPFHRQFLWRRRRPNAAPIWNVLAFPIQIPERSKAASTKATRWVAFRKLQAMKGIQSRTRSSTAHLRPRRLVRLPPPTSPSISLW